MMETGDKKRTPVILPPSSGGKAALKLPQSKQGVTHLPANKSNATCTLPAYSLVEAEEVDLDEKDFVQVNHVNDNGTEVSIRAKLGSREEKKRTIFFQLFLTPAQNYRISRVELKVWFAEHREISKLAQLPDTRGRLHVHKVHPMIYKFDEADYTSSSAVGGTANATPPVSSANVNISATSNNSISGKAYAKIQGSIHNQIATWSLSENEKSRDGLESPKKRFHVTITIPPSAEEDRVLMCCMLAMTIKSGGWFSWSKNPQAEPRYLVWGGHQHAPA